MTQQYLLNRAVN